MADLSPGPPTSSSVRTAALERLSAGLCQQVRQARANARSLCIAHPSLCQNSAPSGDSTGSAFGLNLVLPAGGGRCAGNAGRAVRCSSAELPFIDAAFRSVILYHVIAAGSEAELAEACRVLAPGGDLLIVGLNRSSWAGLDRASWPQLPRLHAVRVTLRLRDYGLAVEERLGAGVCGRSRPAVVQRGWQRVLLPVTDIALLCARHLHRPVAGRPRLKDVPAGLAPTAFVGR